MWLDEAKKKMKGEDPCWDNYEMVGTKKKNGKEVPNCVPKNEEVEQVDELNKDTVYSYKKKSEKEEDEAHEKLEKEMKSGNAPAANKTGKKIMSRLMGQERAEKRLNSEETVAEALTYQQKLNHIRVDSIASTPKHLLGKIGVFGIGKNLGDDEHYQKSVADAHAYGKDKFEGKYEITHVDAKNQKIRAGSVSKVRKGMTEELDQIDELSKTTLSSYVNKSFNDVSVKNKLADKHMAIASMHNKSSKPDAESKSIQNALIMKALAKQRSDRAQKALGKVYGVSEAAGDVNVAFTEAVKKDENVSTKDTKKGEKLSGKQEPIKINPPLRDGR